MRRRLFLVAALWAGLVCAEAGAATCAIPAQHRYVGAVGHYIADLKTSFPEHPGYSAASALTEGNYRAVLDGLRRNAGIDGIRLPIVVGYATGAQYPALYRAIHAYARSLGLLIYASPLSVGKAAFADWSDDRYADWLAAYAAAFHPDALSPFNEAAFDDVRMTGIVTAVRARLGGPVLLVGPDRQHVSGTIRDLEGDPGLAAMFDIIGSHNADRDTSATAGTWRRLVAGAGGKPVWSSENPAGWAGGQVPGLPGLDQAVAGGVAAVVVWKGKPSLVDDAGQPTAKACAIAGHLIAR